MYPVAFARCLGSIVILAVLCVAIFNGTVALSISGTAMPTTTDVALKVGLASAVLWWYRWLINITPTGLRVELTPTDIEWARHRDESLEFARKFWLSSLIKEAHLEEGRRDLICFRNNTLRHRLEQSEDWIGDSTV